MAGLCDRPFFNRFLKGELCRELHDAPWSGTHNVSEGGAEVADIPVD